MNIRQNLVTIPCPRFGTGILTCLRRKPVLLFVRSRSAQRKLNSEIKFEFSVRMKLQLFFDKTQDDLGKPIQKLNVGHWVLDDHGGRKEGAMGDALRPRSHAPPQWPFVTRHPPLVTAPAKSWPSANDGRRPAPWRLKTKNGKEKVKFR